MEAKRNPNKLFTAVFDECHKANVIEMINDELLQSISLYRNLEKRFISVDDDTASLYKGLDMDRGNLLIPNNNINFNITNGNDFDDISWIENVEHYLDYLMRILPQAKMHVLSETWDWVPGSLTSNYLSEKTYGLILANIPFISTHTYPLDILQRILDIEKHPFYEESKNSINNPEKFVEFVKKFMENFEINNNLCILWTNKAHDLLINKINNENSLLDMLINNFKKISPQSAIKTII